ncbi:MAG: T9SS type A sorting domain-containing protein [Ignavibacteria bacterium]|nr:T9SS type A sorting domain-containing protein [Ignavibacteria bacterium]
MYSTNGGETWIGGPEKFTPEEPLLDWKYISGLSVFPVLQASPIVFTLHFVMQADSLQESPDPNFLSSQYYHASFTNNPPSVGNENFPNTFRLEQNYPNPFNPNTKIKYTIPSESFVQLKVYDVLGNEVATLVNEEKPAGNYVINFSAEKNPSGVYFYALNAGDFIQTKKMLLLK